MASRMLGLSLGAAARCSPVCGHADATASARAAVSLTQMCHVHAAFTSGVVNSGDAAPATAGSSEDQDREIRAILDEDPVSRAAEKAADVGRKVKGAVEEVKEAGREVKERAKEVGEDVKESVKQTRP